MKKVIIIGATSGIGQALAAMYAEQGNMVGITGRRTGKLEALYAQFPDRITYKRMDVCDSDCTATLDQLIEEMRGMDLLIYAAGMGKNMRRLDEAVEIRTTETNVLGFVRIVAHAYNYFKASHQQNLSRVRGQIAAISSVAGEIPLGQAPSYSVTKCFMTNYLASLRIKARHERFPLTITTIKPGFIDTDLLGRPYPLMISLAKGAGLIFRAIEKRKRSTIVPGRWRWIMGMAKLIPLWFWERVG